MRSNLYRGPLIAMAAAAMLGAGMAPPEVSAPTPRQPAPPPEPRPETPPILKVLTEEDKRRLQRAADKRARKAVARQRERDDDLQEAWTAKPLV